MLTRSRDHLSNKLSLVRAYRRRDPRVSAYPSVVNIEVSSLCNLSCPMCSRPHEPKRASGTMDFATYRKIVDEVCRYADLAVLHNSGEPLLNRSLPEMISYAHDAGMPTMLSTNATLLREGLAEDLITSGLALIIIALDGATKKTYECIRRGAVLEETESNILSLLATKKRLGSRTPHIVLQFIDMKENRHERDHFIAKWKSHDLRTFVKPSTAQMRHGPLREVAPCDRLWFQTVILSDGTILPCCADTRVEYALGDVSLTSLRDIWNSPDMERIRRSNTEDSGLSGLCRGCTYIPPRRHSVLTDAAQCIFDMAALARLLYALGYTKKSQL